MTNFVSTFASLSKILRKHASGMSIKTDEPGNFYIELPAATPKAKPKFFGAVQAKKRLSRDPCGIDLIMPLPAPAKGCVASA